jgi:hypothetical protein
MMERKVFSIVLIGSLLFLMAALLIPSRTPDKDPKLPWDVVVDSAGSSSVFGLKLGHSTMADARILLDDIGETDLLISKDGSKSVETFFRSVILSGLKADFIMTLKLDPEIVEEIYQRGVQIGTLDSGTRKVDLTKEDTDLAANAPIVHITYLPKTDLDEERIRPLFGDPEQVIEEPETGITHWLYPSIGLDIAIDPQRKEVFQYVNPADFNQIIEPLKQAAENSESE